MHYLEARVGNTALMVVHY